MLALALTVGVVFFILALIFSAFDPDQTWAFRLTMAASFGGMAAFSTAILGVRDQVQSRSKLRNVRRILTQRSPQAEADFAAEFPHWSAPTAIKTRRGLAEFFNAPEDRVFPGDDLEDTYGFSFFLPQLYFHLISRTHPEALESPSINIPSDLVTVRDLVAALNRT